MTRVVESGTFARARPPARAGLRVDPERGPSRSTGRDTGTTPLPRLVRAVGRLDDALRSGACLMPAAESAVWRACEDPADVGELTARWLEGSIGSQPGYAPCHGPDPETRHLIPVLAYANRHGLITMNSQPGARAEDGSWEQRAAVEGLTDTCTLTHLLCASWRTGLLLRVNGCRRRRRREHGVNITRDRNPDRWTDSWQTWGGLGTPYTRSELANRWADLDARTFTQLAALHQVTIVDPVWARDDLLWPALEDAIRHSRRGVVSCSATRTP
jgi:hypothetical protein